MLRADTHEAELLTGIGNDDDAIRLDVLAVWWRRVRVTPGRRRGERRWSR
ncbi:MAG: hypothetical protein JO115_06225 [Pseudonocardiales bacterium]|nr:hypothetical protein [Pseudonocardiales bacterium]